MMNGIIVDTVVITMIVNVGIGRSVTLVRI